MDLSEVERLEKLQQSGMKLSAAIRIGCPFVEENNIYSGCAIATGYWALTGKNLNEVCIRRGNNSDWQAIVADAFRAPIEHVMHVSGEHYSNRKTREQCADWLEAQGY